MVPFLVTAIRFVWWLQGIFISNCHLMKIENSYPVSTTSLGETARWLQLQPSSSWPRRRKRNNKFLLCTTHITRTILLGYIWILDFHFKIVLMLRRRYLIFIRCHNGKRKYDQDDMHSRSLKAVILKKNVYFNYFIPKWKLIHGQSDTTT